MASTTGKLAVRLPRGQARPYVYPMKPISSALFALLLLVTACAPARSEPLIGFNEELILGQLLNVRDRGRSAPWLAWCSGPRPCTENAPPLGLSAAGKLLDRLYLAPKFIPSKPVGGACPARRQARAVHREIISLRISEPENDGREATVFVPDIEAVLKLYARRDIELILAFGHEALPDHILSHNGDAPAQMAQIADTIADFMTTLKRRGQIDRCWMAARLRIEPLNEFNAFNGDPAMMAILDTQTEAQLVKAGVPVKDVVASSIISGRPQDYLAWYRDYYAHGGRAIPNIHLYPEASLDTGDRPSARWAATKGRFNTILTTLKTQLVIPAWHEKRWDGYARAIMVTEIGYPSWGPRALGGTVRPSDFFDAVAKVGGMSMTPGDRILIWRVFRDWDGSPTSTRPLSRFANMALQQSENYSFGMVEYWTGKAFEEPAVTKASGNRSANSLLGRHMGESDWRISADWSPLVGTEAAK